MSRIEQIDRALVAMRDAWPAVKDEIAAIVADKTESLISQNSDETRGAIKALRDLMNLPEALQHEREGLAAALPDSGAATSMDYR